MALQPPGLIAARTFRSLPSPFQKKPQILRYLSRQYCCTENFCLSRPIETDPETFFTLIEALGIGLLIGIERERSAREQSEGASSGVV